MLRAALAVCCGSVSLLQRLKSETHQAHLDLEKAMPLGQPDLTLAGYRRALQAFSAVVPALERRLLALPFPPEFQVASGVRAASLIEDLRVLGLEAASPSRAWDTLTLDEGLGALYVLEGSRLGGAIIARSLPPLGLSDTHGASYFAVTPDLSPRWKNFQAALERQADRADPAAVIAGAKATFSAFLTAWQQASPADMVQG